MKRFTDESVEKFVEYFESPATINALFQELASAALNNTIANDWSPLKRVDMISAFLWFNNLSFAAFALDVDYAELMREFVIKYETPNRVTELLFELLETAMISEAANSWKEDKRSDIVFFTSWINKLATVAFTEGSFSVEVSTNS